MNKKCAACGTDLKTFIGYIPEVGESCMDCYKEYAAKDEEKSLATH